MGGSVPVDVMRSVRPHGYSDLLSAARLPESEISNVAGVVVDAQTMTRSAKDWFVTFTLKDDSSEQLKVRIFHPKSDQLPRLAVGDVAYVRGIQTRRFNGSPMGVAKANTSDWLAFKSTEIPRAETRGSYDVQEDLIPHTKLVRSPQPTEHEQHWAIMLAERFLKSTLSSGAVSAQSLSSIQHQTAANSRLNQPGTSSTVANKMRKFSLIQDIRVGKFHDLTCEVVKKYFNYEYVELYVTDYTENNMLENRSRADTVELASGRGPHGKMTMRVDLFPPHAQHADKHVNEGDLVVVQNVRIKHSSNGKNLEGNLWHDPKFPSKISVWCVRDDEIGLEELKSRRDEYWQREGQHNSRNIKGKKKGRKVKRSHSDEHASKPQAADEMELDEQSDEAAKPPPKYNPNVIALGDDSSLTSLHDIVNHDRRKGVIGGSLTFTYPFINTRYRTSLQVVDFFPHDISHFARKDEQSEDTRLQRYLWHFWLVCTSGEPTDEVDPNLKLNILVEGEHAQRLLGSDFDATAWSVRAKQDPGKHADALRERLFLLWGELEEDKRMFLSRHADIVADESFSLVSHNISCKSLPFICNLGEFGVRATGTDDEDSEDPRLGYQRLYMLLDTALR